VYFSCHVVDLLLPASVIAVVFSVRPANQLVLFAHPQIETLMTFEFCRSCQCESLDQSSSLTGGTSFTYRLAQWSVTTHG